MKKLLFFTMSAMLMAACSSEELSAPDTQKEVADRLGISQSYISRLEKRIINRLRKEMKRRID